MSKPTTGLRRAGIASVATAALALSACVVGAGAANADADFAFDRIAGDNRYETAGEVYDAFGPSDSVILANGEQGHYPDALVANYLAGVEGSPILLTRSDKMPAATQSRLDAADKNITIVGGEGVVSAEQEAALKADGHTVTRLSGANRYETAAAVIEAGGDAASNTALVSTGVDFPDALAAGPVSYDQGSPLAISRADDINDSEVTELVESGVSQFIVVGGPNVVGPEVISELEGAGLDFVTRLSGDDRAATSVAVAEYAIANYGFTNEAINVASGYVAGTGADALAGGPLSGQNSTANLITRNVNNPGDSVLAFLQDNAATLTEGNIFGGPGAVSEAAETAMEAAARMVSSNEDFAVTPGDEATLTVSEGTGDDADRGARTFSLAGLDNDTTYSIALVDAENTSTDANGVVTFDDDADGTADNQFTDFDTDAVIEEVNNSDVTTGNDYYEVKPVQGNITFTIDSETAESVVPVVFVDGDTDNLLDLNADDQPTEDFGTGGQTTWVPAEAAQGRDVAAGTNVDTVDKAADSFTAAGSTFEYDANDTFSVDGAQATFADFEAALSSGDTIAVTDYQPNEALVSDFDLTDANPTAPTGVAANQDGNDVDVTWTAGGGDVDHYNVYRALSANNTDCTTTADAAYTKVGESTTTEFTDEGVVTPEQYCYTVTAVNDGQESARATADFVSTTTPDATAPTSTDALITNDILVGDSVSAGDEWKIVFSEPMAPIAGGETIRVSDGDGSVADVVCGTAPAPVCAFNTAAETVNGTEYAAGRVLTIDFGTTAPTPVTAGTTAGIQYPATVIDQSGISDGANAWDIAGSADKVIDEE